MKQLNLPNFYLWNFPFCCDPYLPTCNNHCGGWNWEIFFLCHLLLIMSTGNWAYWSPQKHPPPAFLQWFHSWCCLPEVLPHVPLKLLLCNFSHESQVSTFQDKISCQCYFLEGPVSLKKNQNSLAPWEWAYFSKICSLESLPFRKLSC